MPRATPKVLRPTVDHRYDKLFKMAINRAIMAECEHRLDSNQLLSAFVLDDPKTKCRSTAVLTQMDRTATVVLCSSNKKIARYHNPRMGLRAIADVSTYALETLVEEREAGSEVFTTFDLFFLDYCKTPSLGSHNWHRDIELCLKMRRSPSTPIYVTFAQRNIPHSASFIRHSISDRFPHLTLSDFTQYCDSAPMIIGTILPKTEAFKLPPLSSYLTANTGDVVQVNTLGGWKATVTRCVSSTDFEVQEEGTSDVYLVHRAEIQVLTRRPNQPTPIKRKVSTHTPSSSETSTPSSSETSTSSSETSTSSSETSTSGSSASSPISLLDDSDDDSSELADTPPPAKQICMSQAGRMEMLHTAQAAAQAALAAVQMAMAAVQPEARPLLQSHSQPLPPSQSHSQLAPSQSHSQLLAPSTGCQAKHIPKKAQTRGRRHSIWARNELLCNLTHHLPELCAGVLVPTVLTWIQQIHPQWPKKPNSKKKKLNDRSLKRAVRDQLNILVAKGILDSPQFGSGVPRSYRLANRDNLEASKTAIQNLIGGSPP